MLCWSIFRRIFMEFAYIGDANPNFFSTRCINTYFLLQRMGNRQSQPREERPRKTTTKNDKANDNGFVRIERTEMPEEYQMVLLSDGVIQNIIQSEPNFGNDERTRELSEDLIKQKEQNKLLVEQLQKMEEKRKAENINAAVSAAVTAAKTIESSTHNSQEKEIEEKRRTFEETAKRVEKTFFSTHWPDACADEQKEIVECLDKFPGQMLSCQSHLNVYRKCINIYQTKLINEQSEANKT